MDKKQRATDLMKLCKVIRECETERRIMKDRREEVLAEVTKLDELIKKHYDYEKNIIGLFDESLTFFANELIFATAMANSIDESKLRFECVSSVILHVNKERFHELKTPHFGTRVKVCVRDEFSNKALSPTFEFQVNKQRLSTKSINQCFDINCYKMRNGLLGCFLQIKPECEKDLQIVINPEQVKDLSSDFINALIAVSMNGAQLKVKKVTPSVE